MNKIKNMFIWTILMITLVMVAGCTGEKQSKQSAAKQELVYVNFRDIRDLNPHLYAGEMYAQEMLYEGLINLTKTGYAPALAESWKISEDGKTYTFKIRKGVQFSDGEVCDAYAIKANFDAIIANKQRHTWLEFMNLYEKIAAVDAETFVIQLQKPYYPLLTELAVTRPFAMISPKAMKDGQTKDGVKAYIGTGPYILKTFVVDQYAVFEANDKYWGEKPKIKKITVKVIPENQTRIMALKNGEIDLIYGKNMLDAETLKAFAGQGEIVQALSEPTSTRHILMNTKNAILTDVSIRKALQHATDKNQISSGIFYGLEKPADTLYAKTVPYCDVDLQAYNYDAQKAAELLEKSGWLMEASGYRNKAGKLLELTLLYNISSVTEKSIAEYLQAEYKKIGVKLNLKGEEEQSYRDNMKSGQFDLVFNISWGMPYDPQSSLAAMRQTVYGDYAAQLGLPDKKAIDEKISEILLSTDENKRKELYREVLSRLHEEALYLPLTYECNKALYKKKLKGVEFAPSQYEVPFSKMYFE